MNKPEPPEDLWERLDEARAATGVAYERPPGSFTRSEYQEKYGLSASQARNHLAKLVKSGKVEQRGTGNLTFYLMRSGK